MSIFDKIQLQRPSRSTFTMDREIKLSHKFDFLYPILCEEILPSDRWSSRGPEVMLRCAPMLAPLMHRVNVCTYTFFVPNRLLWKNFEKWSTGGEDGLQEPLKPRLLVGAGGADGYWKKGTLADYLGVPPLPNDTSNTTGTFEIDAAPFKATALIWNEYFRDQNLQTELDIQFDSDGQLTLTGDLLALKKKAWYKDYFTSALPFSQRGPEVTLPITLGYKQVTNVIDASGGTDPLPVNDAVITNNNPDWQQGSVKTTTGNRPLRFENIDAASTGFTINDLRKATKLQEWYERAAIGGSRYVEQVMAFYGQRSSDARFDRPEFLSAARIPITLSEVLQTGATVTSSGPLAQTPQGNLAGHGISVGSGAGYSRNFEEHGWLMTFLCVSPVTAYQNGLHKKWTRFDRLEVYYPQFAHLGEEDIFNHEIYFSLQAGEADNMSTFGYQSRHASYKHGQSSVHGDFRDTLSFWHLGRQFSSRPVLDGKFVEQDARTDIFAVDDGTDYFWTQIYYPIKANRPMPYYGTPRLT